MKLRTLIVDDEPHAREWLRKQIEDEPDIEIVGECADGVKAVLAIDTLSPDLVFLDIQMPGLDGFGVLQTLDARKVPAFVFVTAFDQYAISAFEVHALDYILKPFGKERVRAAIDRVKARVARDTVDGLQENIRALLAQRAAKGASEWFLVKADGSSFLIKLREIEWVESARNTVRLHVGKRVFSVPMTTAAFEQRLDPDQFLRIHRSTIVNLDAIKEIQSWFHGDYRVILKDGTVLNMSSSYRERLREMRGVVGA